MKAALTFRDAFDETVHLESSETNQCLFRVCAVLCGEVQQN